MSFAEAGFLRVPDVLTAAECERLTLLVPPPEGAGSRCLLSEPWCQALALSLQGHGVLAALLPAGHVAVQCSYFEKSTTRNWLVPVHQDLSIPVAERVDAPALSGWSEKEGELFVQAPIALLEQLVALRLHLDVCGDNDGPLRVVPGTHTLGRLDAEAAERARKGGTEVACTMAQGGVLALRPLLLHASSKSTGTSRRRVLHFVYGPGQPGTGLRWRHGAGV